MFGDVSLQGRLERFSGVIWEDVHLSDWEVVDPIGEVDGYAYILLNGVPARYIVDTEHTEVMIMTEELLFA